MVVECFSWDRLKKLANLADYDAVILNLLSIKDPKTLDARAFANVLKVRTMLEILAANPNRGLDGAIFVLGDPRFNICDARPDRTEESRKRSEVPFLDWTGLEFKWDGRPGTTVEREYEASDGAFKPFADKLEKWQYSLDECHVDDANELGQLLPMDDIRRDGYELTALVSDICASRYHTSIVFSVRIAATRPPRSRIRSDNQPDTLPLTGPIYFLPKGGFSEEEMLEYVLRDLCGVDISAPEPEWISGFVAPGQEEVDRELDELGDRIERLIAEHGDKTEERSEIRRPLKLLYETGMALEEAVCSILEELGAQVERPKERNKEDGWVSVQVGGKTLEGVLEIKGVDKQHFDTYGLKQLGEWIDRGIIFRKKKYTGIFVGNSSITDPPRTRIWPFHHNWITEAKLRGVAAVRSEDLYVAYLLDRGGRLDRDEFWSKLFSSVGPFDMGPYRQVLTAEEVKQLEALHQP